MKLLKEQIKTLRCECYLSHWLCFISYQATGLLVNDMNIICANVFCSLSQIRLAFRCQVIKLVDRYIKASAVNNKLNIISQSSEQSNETSRHVMFVHTRNSNLKNWRLPRDIKNGLREGK